MNKLMFLPFLLVSFLSVEAQEIFDVIIKNGIIYDGSGGEPYNGDIGIAGDTIAAVGNLQTSKAPTIIDATSLAVSPGFINMLSWANSSLIVDGRSQSDIRQGVTLEVLGEGTSMGPLTEKMKQEMMGDQGDLKYTIEWSTLGQYLEFLEKKGISTNVASFVGNGTLRRYIIGMENVKASPEKLHYMKVLLRQAMEEGALGISSSLLYAPSEYADTEELIELAKIAAEYNGMYISHIRDEGDFLLESIDELIRIAKEANIHAEIYHLKASGENNWGKMDKAITKIDSARNAGLSITADMYTYPASSTGLHVQLPAWVREGGVGAMLDRLSIDSLRKKAIDDIIFSDPPESILLVGLRNEALRKYIGMRLNEVAEALGKSPEETLVDLIVEDNSRIQVVYFSMSEENIKKKITQPWMSFCSDAGSYTNEGVFLKQSTHPRAYGSFTRVLGKYSRDEKLFPLEEGIRRLTSLPAQNLKIEKRGYIIKGYYADIVIFDPEKINDRATFEEPHQYSEGVIHVLVNGVQVLKNGEHTGATPGRAVRGPGWKNMKSQ